MSGQVEIRISGLGGQGVITAGIILAEAAVLDLKNAIQTQSYGPEARGGASKAEVIISEESIDFPKIICPNLTLALTQFACDKYINNVRSNGIIIVDEGVVLPKNLKTDNVYSLPILRSATEVIGKSIVANIIALGVIVELTHIVTKESLEKAISLHVPKGTELLNHMALVKGYELIN